VIDYVGRPLLKRRKGTDRTQSATMLEERVKERMPERTVLEILAEPPTGSGGIGTSARHPDPIRSFRTRCFATS
jgi:hypothetical protein